MADIINITPGASQTVNTLDESNLRQMQAFELISKTNQSFFLTGRAGTGKTTFLKNVQLMVDKQFLVAAPTGIAAIVAGGVTIHSLFGLSLEVQGPRSHGSNLSEEKINAIRGCETIILDEVSMVRCDVIDSIDRTLRIIMGNNLPFGGKQMIFTGDMFQLPPVLRAGAESEAMLSYYNTTEPFFFKAHVFRQMPIPTIEFEKVYRQEDQFFLNILSNIRAGIATHDDLYELNRRCITPPATSEPIISLTTLKATAEKINKSRLAELQSELHTYTGTLEGKFAKGGKDNKPKDDSLPAPLQLELKVGAQVIFTRNDVSQRWANGSLGIVVKLTDEEIQVEVNGAIVTVAPEVWESVEYKFDKKEHKLNKEVIGSFMQYPLRLAWAITIHKSQGLTFDKMILDLTRGAFASGQLYVALSRVRSIDGLYLTRPIRTKDIMTDNEILAFASKFNNDTVIESQLAEGKALYPLLKAGDPDAIIKKYLELALAAIQAGESRYASALLKKMMNNMVMDDTLFNTVDASKYIRNESGAVADFNNAIVCLYGGKPELAVTYADKVLAHRRLYEAFFIKTRALTLLGRYKEADELNVDMVDMINPENGGQGYDPKIRYSLVEVNMQVGDPYLNYLQSIIQLQPNYLPAIKRLAEYMKREGKQLQLAEGYELPELAKLQNEATVEEFMNKLSAALTDDKEAFNDYIKAIGRQIFN
jgi:hypothetical protein